MKKIAFIMTGVLLSGAAFAQTSNQNTTNDSNFLSNPGFYSGIRGGVVIPGNYASDTGLNVGGQVGYRFGNGFRLEEAFNYMRSNYSSGFSGHQNVYTLMTNGYYDFNTGTRFTPYLGAGIGYVRSTLSDDAVLSVGGTKSDNSFAYQGIAGVGYQISQNVGIDVQYRILSNSANILSNHANIVEAGLNYYF